jgi:EAL domain-containing protein (putative c-di-GMP-specific phosphodiesterase class I)
VHTVPALAPTPVPTGAALDAVLTERLVRPVFQPIIDLSTRTVVGVEALARGPAGTALEFPDRLFAAAAEAGRLGELDMLCAERALESAMAAATAPPLVFVNAEPAVLDQPLSPRLLELLGRVPFRIVLEYTERALPAVPGSLLRLAGHVQHSGNSLALDDVGVDPMSLAFLPVLEPEVIKLDMSLIRDPHTEHTRAVCAVVRAEAQRTGAVVIAEGIETEDDLRTAGALGARWGQGWLFGRPGRIEQAAHQFDTGAGSVLRTPRPGFHLPAGTPFEVAAARGPVTAATPEAIAAALTRIGAAIRTDDTAVVVASRPDIGIPAISGSLQELIGHTRSVIVLDRPVPGEFAVAVLGPGYGHALCVRWSATPHLVTLDQLPEVAAVTRVLLNRHR